MKEPVKQSLRKIAMRYYAWALMVMITIGLLVTAYHSVGHDKEQLQLLGLVGTAIGTSAGLVLDLLFFLPVHSRLARFIVPGCVHVASAMTLWYSDPATAKFMTAIAVANLGVGCVATFRTPSPPTN